MHRDAGGFANRHQAGNDGVGIAILENHHLAMIVGGNAAHVVMHGWQHRRRFLGHIDSGENPGGFGNTGQPLVDHIRTQMLQVQINMILVFADSAPFADFDGHRPADHIAGRQVFGVRRVALHEPIAVGIGQVAAFAATAFGHQTAGAVNAGGMELGELHIL